MELHTLKPAAGATKSRKRIARGPGSGKGGTSTRGHKGAKSRSGWKSKRGFEGGQMPLQMRLPKRGFKNPFRVEYVGVNLDFLDKLATENKLTSISKDTLIQHNIIDKKDNVKILGRGELKAKITVEAHGYSKTAQAAIEAQGGVATTL